MIICIRNWAFIIYIPDIIFFLLPRNLKSKSSYYPSSSPFIFTRRCPGYIWQHSSSPVLKGKSKSWCAKWSRRNEKNEISDIHRLNSIHWNVIINKIFEYLTWTLVFSKIESMECFTLSSYERAAFRYLQLWCAIWSKKKYATIYFFIFSLNDLFCTADIRCLWDVSLCSVNMSHEFSFFCLPRLLLFLFSLKINFLFDSRYVHEIAESTNCQTRQPRRRLWRTSDFSFHSILKIFHSHSQGVITDETNASASSSPLSASDAGATESNNQEEDEGGDEAEEEEDEDTKKVLIVRDKRWGTVSQFLLCEPWNLILQKINEKCLLFSEHYDYEWLIQDPRHQMWMKYKKNAEANKFH